MRTVCARLGTGFTGRRAEHSGITCHWSGALSRPLIATLCLRYGMTKGYGLTLLPHQRIGTSTTVEGKLDDGDVASEREKESGKERERIYSLIAHRPSVNRHDHSSLWAMLRVLPTSDIRYLILNERCIIGVVQPFFARKGRVKLKIIHAADRKSVNRHYRRGDLSVIVNKEALQRR